jgi:hypothetical protein
MEHKASFKYKAGSNTVVTHSATSGIFQRDCVSPLLFCTAHLPLPNELNRADCRYQVHGTERKISLLLYMDDLKLVDRNEENVENGIKIMTAISKDINPLDTELNPICHLLAILGAHHFLHISSIRVNMNFVLEKSARICLKRR